MMLIDIGRIMRIAIRRMAIEAIDQQQTGMGIRILRRTRMGDRWGAGLAGNPKPNHTGC
jgi:hypothetical protein